MSGDPGRMLHDYAVAHIPPIKPGMRTRLQQRWMRSLYRREIMWRARSAWQVLRHGENGADW